MAKTVFLKVTSAFLVAGKIAKVGEVVEVDESDAKSLLHRGKAVLAVVEKSEQLPEKTEQQSDEDEQQSDEDEQQPQADAEAEPAAEQTKAKGGKKGK